MVAGLVIALPLLVLLGLGLGRAGSVYLKFRGKRVIPCPELGQPAAVDLSAVRIALKAVFRKPVLRLLYCSNWTGHGGCNQDCLAQLGAAPEEYRVRRILTKWYAGKACVCCGTSVEQVDRLKHKPCLMSPDLKILEWTDIEPQEIPKVLETHQPLCWNCLVAETHTW
jgi:hypothetical protein